MKKLILASAVMLAMTACETSTSSSDGGNTVNGFSCNVTRADKSVTMYETSTQGSYKQTQTVYQDQYGYDYSIWTTDIVFSDPTEAAYECADEKEEASHWLDGSYQVECTSNSVHVRQRDDSGLEDMDETVINFQEMCAEGYRRAENGTLYDDYED
jgi:hypothetical protein